MRGPLNEDDIERLEVSARTPTAHRTAAAKLQAWAEESHPDDQTTPAELLHAAAWHLDTAGDQDGALELHRRSVAALGDVPPDKRTYLHGALLDAGLQDEARHLADEVRRSAPSDPEVYAFMAENYELVGDLQQALRWINIGLRHAELPGEDDDPEDMGYRTVYLLRGRRRVRQALGFPPDDVDELVPPVHPSAYE